MLHVSARWVSQNLSAHDRHWRVASSQELLRSYTCDKELFCRRLDTGDKLWIYLLDPLSKLKFAVEGRGSAYHTFTQICRPILSHYLAGLCQQFFLGYRRTAYGKLSASWKDSNWSVFCNTNIQVTRCNVNVM